jgi:hypothetical protein
MVAELVTPLDRGLEPQPKPRRRDERLKRRRDWFIVKRMGRAKTGDEKFAAAADYLRAMATDHRADRVEADTTLEHLTRTLIDAADALAKSIRRHR